MKLEDYVFSLIESPEDIEKFSVEGFDFFKGLGIIDYKRTFKAWLRKFPKPLFLVAAKGDRIISWVHIDEWRGNVAKDGNSINILRAIETLPAFRSKKIGYRLVFLGLQYTVGYMITKPVSMDAKRFFHEIGFRDDSEFKNCPVNLGKHSGYMILPLYRKSEFVKDFSKKYLLNNSIKHDHKNNKITAKKRKDQIKK